MFDQSLKILSVNTPIGWVWLLGDDEFLTEVVLSENMLPRDGKGIVDSEKAVSKALSRAAELLKRWGAGETLKWDPIFHPQGTPFQFKVWRAVMEMPFGEVTTYHDLAWRISEMRNCPYNIEQDSDSNTLSKSHLLARAVGRALGANPIPILIPCHRVIRSDGSLGGYSSGIEIKKKLIEYERKHRV